MRLILVRHGETEANRLGRTQGVSAAPLNERGRRQAAAVARALAADAPFALYSSPLRRAVETADAIAKVAGVDARREDSLIEMDVGEMEGLDGDEMRRRFPEVMRAWRENAADTTLPGGESLSEVQDRAWRTLWRLAVRHESDTVVAVTHNFVILSILCAALGMPLNGMRRLRVDLGSVTRLDVGRERCALVSANESERMRVWAS